MLLKNRQTILGCVGERREYFSFCLKFECQVSAPVLIFSFREGRGCSCACK